MVKMCKYFKKQSLNNYTYWITFKDNGKKLICRFISIYNSVKGEKLELI